MTSERRKQRVLQQLQALEQKARHLQRLLDSGELGEQLEVLANIADHWQEVRSLFWAEVLERGLLRATRADEVDDIVDELLHWLQRLRF